MKWELRKLTNWDSNEQKIHLLFSEAKAQWRADDNGVSLCYWPLRRTGTISWCRNYRLKTMAVRGSVIMWIKGMQNYMRNSTPHDYLQWIFSNAFAMLNRMIYNLWKASALLKFSVRNLADLFWNSPTWNVFRWKIFFTIFFQPLAWNTTRPGMHSRDLAKLLPAAHLPINNKWIVYIRRFATFYDT